VTEQPLGAAWQAEAEAIVSGMREWRAAHPHATWTEIEAAVDERVWGLRARMLADVALASERADRSGARAGERGTCATCGSRLVAQGKQTRGLVTQGGREVRLHRDYVLCPTCRVGHFPPG
jgi:hypothetical protein